MIGGSFIKEVNGCTQVEIGGDGEVKVKKIEVMKIEYHNSWVWKLRFLLKS